MKLSWNKQKNATGYIVQYICGGFPKENAVGDVTSVDLIELMLKPDTDYTFRVLAVNKQGRGLPSQTIEYKTPMRTAVPKPVQGLKIV